jgi:Na+/H+ antiporter NhaD/arsenite permease-like protein
MFSDNMLPAIILFALTYILLLFFSKYRAYIALASAALFVVLGILPVGKIFGSVDWNVIMMIAGTMGVVSLFIESKMPALLADLIIDKMPNVKWATIALALFAGIISAFVDNVATVLMVAPVAVTIAKKLKISPVNSIIAIAISSNLQGAATLVGDTTSILLGSHAGMNFIDFFVYKGRPGLFWLVQIAAIISALVLVVLFRKDKLPIQLEEKTTVEDYFPSWLLSGTVLLLILASFLPDKLMVGSYTIDKPRTINGLICIALFVFGLIREIVFKKNYPIVKKALKEIDYFTLLLLAGLFVVIGGISEAGVVTEISKVFVSVSQNNVFVIYTLIVWASVIFSAFIDNIPYVATMLPVAAGIAKLMGVDPTLIYFGLITGATLGGNLTPIGASANIAGLGILRKEGYEVSVGKFMKISVPFTLSAVLSGYVLVWLIWS